VNFLNFLHLKCEKRLKIQQSVKGWTKLLGVKFVEVKDKEKYNFKVKLDEDDYICPRLF
jgi:hypothetical protein